MAYSNVFVDSDIILDMILQREPFYQFSQLLFTDDQGITLNTSALVIANINYLLTSQLGKAEAKRTIEMLMREMDVLSFERSDIDSGLKSAFTDMEDAIQHSIALKHGCEVIITRNLKDYKHSAIPVMTAEQFLRTIYKA